jgi:hypothetical protein
MYKKQFRVYIDDEPAAFITVDIKEEYARDVGTNEQIGKQLEDFLTKLIQKNSYQENLQ